MDVENGCDAGARKACCSSISSMSYWFTISVVAWDVLSIAELHSHLLRPYSASTILLAAGIGCAANWAKNRTLHCGITGPLFLVAGMLILLSQAEILHIEPTFVWPFVIAGISAAFFIEWKYAARSR